MRSLARPQRRPQCLPDRLGVAAWLSGRTIPHATRVICTRATSPRASGVLGLRLSPQPQRAYARPALASVGVWKYSLSDASCSISRLSSAIRPSAVLMGMQS